jgi:hypothetical protein
MANEIKNQDIEKWALDITRKVSKGNNIENDYFTGQRKLLHLKQKMRKTIIRKSKLA